MRNMIKKYEKRFSIILTALFMLGIAGLFFPQESFAAKANDKTSVGFVNRQKIWASYPGIQSAFDTLRITKQEMQNDFDTNAKDLPEQEKIAYAKKLQQQIVQKENELQNPIEEKIMAAINDVAQKKGVSLVIEGESVVYGGVDITDDVIKNITGK